MPAQNFAATSCNLAVSGVQRASNISKAILKVIKEETPSPNPYDNKQHGEMFFAAGFSPLRMPITGRAPVRLNRIRPPSLHPSPNVAGPDGLLPWLAYWFLGRSLGQALRVA
jgi:hypothetical protein